MQSRDEKIAAIAEKSIKEVRYHLRRSSDLIIRLGDGSQESHQRMQQSIDALWMYTGELFTPDAIDLEMQQQGIAPDLLQLHAQWKQHIQQVFTEATLLVPSDQAWMQKGGKTGVHTEHLGFLLAEMQFLQRAYPGAQW